MSRGTESGDSHINIKAPGVRIHRYSKDIHRHSKGTHFVHRTRCVSCAHTCAPACPYLSGRVGVGRREGLVRAAMRIRIARLGRCFIRLRRCFYYYQQKTACRGTKARLCSGFQGGGGGYVRIEEGSDLALVRHRLFALLRCELLPRSCQESEGVSHVDLRV